MLNIWNGSRLAVCAALVMIVAGGLFAPKTARSQGSTAPIVSTRDGLVQGFVKDGARQYLGIPFAAPPVGSLRWRPPQAPASWAGLRKTTAFGGSCPQGRDIGDYAKASDTEDCLYLNVYAPARGSTKAQAVMVWIPGGGLFAGAADDFDGARLAARGDVVLVTLNYRIGVLGFFAHPAIDGEGHLNGNYGILDQQAALHWVRDNIAAFGGDPGNVTIFGQSAGGSSVIANLYSPMSKGLFHKAIDESGQRLSMPTEAEASKIGSNFAQAAGCADQSAACLRALSVKQIVKVQPKFFAGTIQDDKILPNQAYEALRSGRFNGVPMINGIAADEQTFILAIAEETDGPLTAEGYAKFIKGFGANADRVAAAYPLSKYASPSLAEVDAVEGQKACVTHRLSRWYAAKGTTWAYQFDDRTAPSYFKPASFPMGAYHTAEIPYLFPLFHGGTGTPRPLNATQQKLSDGLIDAWASFARTGNPNPSGLGAWTAYDPAHDNVLSINSPQSVMRDNYGSEHNCALWDTVGRY